MEDLSINILLLNSVSVYSERILLKLNKTSVSSGSFYCAYFANILFYVVVAFDCIVTN